jgi:hypothetical protein
MAANAQAVCNSFKVELLDAKHAFGATVVRGATTKDTFNGALYLVNQSYGAGTTAYSASGEVSSVNYTAGGQAITNATAPTLDGSVAIWTPSANLSWTLVTFASFDTLLVYNATQSNTAVAVYTFGAQTITAGNFTLTMPANAAATALLQLA